MLRQPLPQEEEHLGGQRFHPCLCGPVHGLFPPFPSVLLKVLLARNELLTRLVLALRTPCGLLRIALIGALKLLVALFAFKHGEDSFLKIFPARAGGLVCSRFLSPRRVPPCTYPGGGDENGGSVPPPGSP